MRIDNLASSAKKNFGVDFECLTNKRNLKKLVAIGVATTAAVSYFNVAINKASDGTEDSESVETILNRVINMIKPFEKSIKQVLPVALVVCALKFFNEDTKLSDIRDKLEGCFFIAQDVMAEKLGIDDEESFFNKENLKKLAILAGIAILIFFIYGKKLRNGKSDKDGEQANSMVAQILPIIAPVIPVILLFAPQMKEFFGSNNDNKDESSKTELLEEDLVDENDVNLENDGEFTNGEEE